jgi:hypothetical protein
MILEFQSREGHTTVEHLTDAEVDRRFRQLISEGRRAYIETSLDRLAPHDFIGTVEEARRRGARKVFFTGAMSGG